MITIYTDGSASVRDMKGGCGAYIIENKKERFISKGFYPTKTGRMELMAILLSLQSIENKRERVLIYSDSKYAINTCTEWIYKWESECWNRNKNTDICKKLIKELRLFRERGGMISFKHIKGHQDNLEDPHVLGNNIADALASKNNFTEFEKDLEVTKEDLQKLKEKYNTDCDATEIDIY